MNKDLVKGHWDEIQGKLQQKWGKFTSDDISHMDGSSKELLGELQKKYGYGKEQASEKLNAFLKENGWTNGEDTLLSRAAEEIKAYSHQLKEQSKEVRKNAEKYVKNYPLIAVGAAFVVGASIALLLKRK